MHFFGKISVSLSNLQVAKNELPTRGFFAKDAQIVAILEVKAIFPIATSQSSGNRPDFKKVVFSSN